MGSACVFFAFGAERGQDALSWRFLSDPERAAKCFKIRGFYQRLDVNIRTYVFGLFLGEGFPGYFILDQLCWFHCRKGMSPANHGLSEPLFKEQRFARAACSASLPVLPPNLQLGMSQDCPSTRAAAPLPPPLSMGCSNQDAYGLNLGLFWYQNAHLEL